MKMLRILILLMLVIQALIVPVDAFQLVGGWAVGIESNSFIAIGFEGQTNLQGFADWIDSHWNDVTNRGYISWADLASYLSTNSGGYVNMVIMTNYVSTFVTSQNYATRSDLLSTSNWILNVIKRGYSADDASLTTLYNLKMSNQLVLADGSIVTSRWSAVPYIETVTAYSAETNALSTSGFVIATGRTIRASTETMSNAWNGTTFTAPYSGYYMANVTAEYMMPTIGSGANEVISGAFYLNGSMNDIATRALVPPPGGTQPRLNSTWAGYIVQGGTMDYRTQCALGSTMTYYRVMIMLAGCTNQY